MGARKIAVYYQIRDKKVGFYDYIKENEVPYVVYALEDYLNSGDEEADDPFVMRIIESEDLFSEITKITKGDNNYQDKKQKYIDLIMASNVFDGYELQGYSEDVHFGYTDVNDKYLLLKRYFIAFKIALSKIGPAPSLTEEGDPNVLDSYLKWLEDLYKEINPKSKVPELSKVMLEDLNCGWEGMMGNGEYAFGTYESDYNSETKRSFFFEEAHPSSRFDFQPNNEVSFKSRIRDILVNKNIFYTFEWGLT